MKPGLFAILFTAACGGSVTGPADEPDAATDAYAHHDAIAETTPHDAAPDVVDASREADADGRICCQTGQNLLACDPSAPWSCPVSPTHITLCTSPDCAIGSSCEGFNGTGVVVVCGM